MASDSIPDWCSEILEPQDDQGKRRLLLLQTAFDLIAETGFEGLRTRAVAAGAGVNIATLHYYFPSKQDLVEGVAQLLSAKFVTVHGLKPEPSGFAALDRLRQEFADGEHYLKCEPKMLLVMQEFVMRGKRDSAVQKIVDLMNFHWRQGIELMVKEGLESGVFRNDVDAQVLCALLMSIFAGAVSTGGDRTEEVARTTESWILSDKVKVQLEQAGVKR